jgi:hypothetical protein
MIYNLVSVKKVIAKVFADLDLQEQPHRISDMIEYSGEALKKIGAFPAMVTRVTGKEDFPLLLISNYQAKLPVDLNTINQVSYSVGSTGPFYPMRYATGSYSSNHVVKGTEGTNTTPHVPFYPSQYSTTTSNIPSSEKDTIFSLDYSYIIVGGYIKTNIKDGYLLISYQAIPTDRDNYPLIPDDESFFEAIYWYINMKLTYPEWKNGRIRDAVYYDAKSSWNFYRKQAYANAMMPNPDQLESIKNTWIRLIPEINAHDTFYSTLGEQETVYNNDLTPTVLFPFTETNISPS